jgi:thioester reductase-like protein
MKDNYFTCTLGQAQHYSKTRARSIPEFLELQAKHHGERPAIGFPGLGGIPTCLLTFHELNEETKNAARNLVRQVPAIELSIGRERTVALLAQSNLLFLKTWLGLIRLGFSVLLLAPQLDKASMEHLCQEQHVEYLFHDSEHAGKAAEVQAVKAVQLDAKVSFNGGKYDSGIESQIGPQGKTASIPYLHHSSGTSSGKPKAIPQSNNAAFAALPCFVESPARATFSTTPLYHGGVADCFRAWTSGQMIWLFPGGAKPITAQNVITCLSAAQEANSSGLTAPIKYFSSVPFVLKDLAANEDGLRNLREMNIVGVGGAAFPSDLGQQLVSQGVNLVSRYGSAECGFLLSSYRDFESDKSWDYLRSNTGTEHLLFESRDDGLVELIVKPGWPHLAKTNREDGSYATADLFEKHSTKPNAWRYHSRADAQITLASGKKFDPEPIESAVLSRCPADYVLDVIIFGDGESYPGALIFVKAGQSEPTGERRARIWSAVDEVNQKGPSQARLSKGMLKLIVHRSEKEPPLEKSSKGTILRRRARERYSKQMKQAYEGPSAHPELGVEISSRSDLIAAIAKIVGSTTGKRLGQDADFFAEGIDSVACIQIRNAIQNLMVSLQDRSEGAPERAPMDRGKHQPNSLRNVKDLPTNLLYDCGTIEKVAEYLLGRGESSQNDELALMKEFVAKYSDFGAPNKFDDSPTSTRKNGRVVLLTGATGALGTHLLDVLRTRPDVERIYCLLRAADPLAAYERVNKALSSKAKEGLKPFGAPDKVICLPCDLSRPDLGLDESMRREISSTMDVIIHAAWAVNFTLRLKSFEFHLAGLRNLLNAGFAAASRVSERSHRRSVTFAFCSSIASVSSSSNAVVEERISNDPAESSPLGYSRSKWIAESICVNASNRAKKQGVPFDVKVLRIGQLCGDTKCGIWNKSEAWPIMLSTFDVTGCMPDLLGEKLNWLPLDVAANTVNEIAFEDARASNPVGETAVYHILNPHTNPSWRTMLQWLQEQEGTGLEIVEPGRWLDVLQKRLATDSVDHPSRKLLALWKDAYSDMPEMTATKPAFSVESAARASGVMRNVKPVSKELVEKMWEWTRRSC